MSVPLITLNNGIKAPVLGLGTWQGVNNPSEVENAIRHAINIGYRHFDCAAVYGNEREIGKVVREKIADGTVKREDLFIVTKNDVDYIETWRGMEKCIELNLTKSIGLSNFNSMQITRILSYAKIMPTINQIECHVNLIQKKLRQFCSEKNIAIIAYSPFGAPNTPGSTTGFKSLEKLNLDVKIIFELAKKYNKTKFQIALRYLIDIGTIAIPKSSSEKNLQANFDIFDFKLTSEEIEEIDKLDCGKRTCPGVQYKGFKYYPFDDEF
ncbi:aldo-keto reductase AKR2E4-like isoform X2 [Leptopilina boulardi]|uniref:aldo-keto reductase AKR2E4-like isoform X2 n=1 Tax=Leptopilina boulardi TaxID=63433 RepID=UPI0021F55C0F|nr:aldo-keto reductase AKR2E4-like isoform X2 [Leptopilina boulardi]